MDNLRINGERLWSELMEPAAIGATEGRGLPGGADRPRPSGPRPVQGADAGAGCGVSIDRWARCSPAAAERAAFAPIAMGSHLDTQPTGGNSTVCSACSALEACALLSKPATRPSRRSRWRTGPTRRARASPPRWSPSGVFAGAFDAAWASAARIGRRDLRRGARRDRLSRRAQSAGASVGGLFRAAYRAGTILEAGGQEIGIVTGIQGIRWFERVRGEDRHAGTTPMALRRDALLGAARWSTGSRRRAAARPPRSARSACRSQADSPNVDSGRGVLHRRSAPSRRRPTRRHGRVRDAVCRLAGSDRRASRSTRDQKIFRRRSSSTRTASRVRPRRGSAGHHGADIVSGPATTPAMCRGSRRRPWSSSVP